MTTDNLQAFLDSPAADQLITRLNITLDIDEQGRVRGRMPVAGNRQPLGIMHGGANAVLAESVGSVAAYLHAGLGGSAFGVDLSCTHHRWVSRGEVTGVCTPLFEGDRFATYHIEITDYRGQLTCTARLTAAVSHVRAEAPQ
ncbi:hotdog fold thioesterase [Mycobacterium sp. PDNC021]|uniref:hotdog fold thioesterase n=1 Tax=Mycobacterium sp. PDNC021 TaxID=3391399 RepID=UPI003AB0A4AA